MNEPRDRHRRWLDSQMPSKDQRQAELRATLNALDRTRNALRLRPHLLAAAAAVSIAAVAVFVTTRNTTTARPAGRVVWDTTLALHVTGAPAGSGTQIKISVHEESRP